MVGAEPGAVESRCCAQVLCACVFGPLSRWTDCAWSLMRVPRFRVDFGVRSFPRCTLRAPKGSRLLTSAAIAQLTSALFEKKLPVYGSYEYAKAADDLGKSAALPQSPREAVALSPWCGQPDMVPDRPCEPASTQHTE